MLTNFVEIFFNITWYIILQIYTLWIKFFSGARTMNQVFVELENTKIKQDQYSRELNKRWTIHTIRTSFFSSAISFLCWDVEWNSLPARGPQLGNRILKIDVQITMHQKIDIVPSKRNYFSRDRVSARWSDYRSQIRRKSNIYDRILLLGKQDLFIFYKHYYSPIPFILNIYLADVYSSWKI